MLKIIDLLNGIGTGPERRGAGGAGTKDRLSGERRSLFRGVSFIDYFGLKENPFADAIDLHYYFEAAGHRKACRRMVDTVRDGISMGLVTGPSGSGKTLVSQLLLEGLDTDSTKSVLVLVTPKMGKTTLLREILRETGMEPKASRSRDLLDMLHRAVLDLHGEGKRLVILIDEAHFLNSEALHMLRTISNLEVPKRKLSTCLLFAEERFLRRLSHPSHRSLATRMYHRAHLGPMTAEETMHYVHFRIMVATGSTSLLKEEACEEIFSRSGGICREVNRLCYLALTESAAGEEKTITADLIKGL